MKNQLKQQLKSLLQRLQCLRLWLLNIGSATTVPALQAAVATAGFV
jgi:hypothetical protein